MVQVAVLLMPSILSLNQTSTNVILCLIIRNIRSSPILTSIIQIILQAWKMSLMLSMITPSRLQKGSSFMEKTSNYAVLLQMRRFITMVSRKKAMTLSLTISCALPAVQDLKFPSADKSWVSSRFQALAVTTL